MCRNPAAVTIIALSSDSDVNCLLYYDNYPHHQNKYDHHYSTGSAESHHALDPLFAATEVAHF